MEISSRLIKAFERFNADLDAFRKETGEDFAALYEDANTPRYVKDFKLYKSGSLKWKENELEYSGKAGGWIRTERKNSEPMMDDDEARDYLSFWRANLRRAKRYWAMDSEKLDAIQNGEQEDEDE